MQSCDRADRSCSWRALGLMGTLVIIGFTFGGCSCDEKKVLPKPAPTAAEQQSARDSEVAVDTVATETPATQQVFSSELQNKIEWVFSEAAGVYFSKYEITVGLYTLCAQEGGCAAFRVRTVEESATCNLGQPGKLDHPVNCISWQGADEFCQFAGGRLPDAREWMAELNGSGATPKPWNSDEKITCDDVVWTGMHQNGCGKNGTWPVCSKPLGNSVSGVCDMAGNVWEWMAASPEAIHARDDMRFLKGGSWRESNPQHFSVSFTRVGKAYEWADSFGFHCVRDRK